MIYIQLVQVEPKEVVVQIKLCLSSFVCFASFPDFLMSFCIWGNIFQSFGHLAPNIFKVLQSLEGIKIKKKGYEFYEDLGI
jgi:hypothetical protein